MRKFGKSVIFFLAAVLWAGGALKAQTVRVGNLLEPPAEAVTALGSPSWTMVDLSSPATGSGDLNIATFTVTTTCDASFSFRFFRPSGSSLIFLAERGPIHVTAADNDKRFSIPLSPTVPVQAGDLIGIGTSDGTCIGASSIHGGGSEQYFYFTSDVRSTVSTATTTRLSGKLMVYAQGVSNVSLAAVLPVVVSTAGVPPSFFRTYLQLHNPGTSTLAGEIRYHPAGFSASAADPSLAFSLAPGQTQYVPDFLPAIGMTGIGSADIYSGLTAPVVLARVFNDAGAAGTTGFTENLILPDQAIGAGMTGVLLGPPDLALYRLNVGVRTLAQGASVTVTARASTGGVITTLIKTFPPDYFEQVTAAVFLGGTPLPANGSIRVRVDSGSIIVYGATADNTTQDPSVQLASTAP